MTNGLQAFVLDKNPKLSLTYLEPIRTQLENLFSNYSNHWLRLDASLLKAHTSSHHPLNNLEANAIAWFISKDSLTKKETKIRI